MLQTHALPARFYSTPEYREGYAAGTLAAQSGEPPANPFLPHDLHHLGWADASYDSWSARRTGLSRRSARRGGSRPPMVASVFAA